jgi:methanogenic corrinoid protein MtbC1
VIAPALASVGEKWHGGTVSIAKEHLATSIAMRLIGRMGPRFARKGRSKGVVIVTTPPGERHTIPSLMVSDLLRGAGFDVLDLGADVPVDTLPGIIETTDGLVAVCLSSTRANAERPIRRVIRSVRKAAPGVPVFLGGASVPDAAMAEALGADAWASSGAGAVELVLETARPS